MVQAGAVPPLVAQLSDGSDEAKQAATCAICALSGPGGGEDAIVAAGGVGPLVSLIENGGERVEAHAITALHNLARCPRTIKDVAAVPSLIRACVNVLTRSLDADVRTAAAATLACISEAGSKAEIVQLGTSLGLVSKHTSYVATQPPQPRFQPPREQA